MLKLQYAGLKPSKQSHVLSDNFQEDELFNLRKTGDKEPEDLIKKELVTTKSKNALMEANKKKKQSSQNTEEDIVLKTVQSKEKPHFHKKDESDHRDSNIDIMNSRDMTENKENINSRFRMKNSGLYSPKSFDKEFNELAYKIYQQSLEMSTSTEILISPKKTKEIERKCMAMDKMYQDELSLRLMNEAKTLEEHYNNLEDEMKECTFNPKVHEFGDKRSLNQFLKDQDNFEKVRNERKTKIQEKINQDHKKKCPYKPKLSTESKRLTNLKMKESAFQRLFKEPKQKVIQSHLICKTEENESDLFDHNVNKTEEINYDFIPKITEKAKKLPKRPLPYIYFIKT